MMRPEDYSILADLTWLQYACGCQGHRKLTDVWEWTVECADPRCQRRLIDAMVHDPDDAA